MNDEFRLAEMLCTRICHDLAGPIGALGNGTEFIAEADASMMEQAIELISSSAKEAVARLLFFRHAYGRINASGEASISEIRKLAADFFSHRRIEIVWPDFSTESSDVPFSRRMARLFLNMLLISCETMIKGGVATVRIEKVGHKGLFEITAKGPAIKFDPKIEGILKNGPGIEEADPKGAQAYMTAKLAEELGVTLEWALGEDTFRFTAIKNLG